MTAASKTTAVDLFRWERKRNSTYISFCMIAICHGAEYSILIPSLWFYLADVIKTDHAEFYYGLTLALFYVSSILSSMIVTWQVDKTRNVRSTVICLLCIEILGNVLYTIYTSVYFPLIARFIQGIADVNMSIIISELARSYPVQECTSKISNIVTCISVSIVVAPALNIVFKYIDFTIYGFTINYGNFPAVFMAIINCIALSNAIVNVYDLSKEYDLKKETQQLQEEEEEEKESEGEEGTPLEKINRGKSDWEMKETQDQEEKVMLGKTSHGKHELWNEGKPSYNPWILLRSVDFVLLVLLGCFMSFNIVAFLDVAMPIISAFEFGFASQGVALLFFLTGLLFILTLQIIKKITKVIGEFRLLCIGITVFATSICLLYLVLVMKSSSITLRLVLFIANVLLLGESWCVEQVFIRSMVAKIVPSKYQSFGEGLRRIASSIGSILSSILIPLTFRWLNEVCIVVVVITGVFMLALILRRRTLMESYTICA